MSRDPDRFIHSYHLERGAFANPRPLPVRSDHRLLGAPPRVVCPRCGEQMREVAGFDDYCPTCRQREELVVEREAVATGKVQLTGWLEEWSDAAPQT